MDINAWVIPDSPAEGERIIGRVVSVGATEPAFCDVAWLSSERGLWRNLELDVDLIAVPRPDLILIEAIMVETASELVAR